MRVLSRSGQKYSGNDSLHLTSQRSGTVASNDARTSTEATGLENLDHSGSQPAARCQVKPNSMVSGVARRLCTDESQDAFSLGRYCLVAIAIGYTRCKAWLRAPVDHAVLPFQFSLVIQPYRRAHRPAMRRRVQLCCTTRRAIPLARRPSRGRGPAIGSPDAWARGGHWSALHGGPHRRGQMWVLLVTCVSRSDVSSCIEPAAGRNIQT